MSSVLTYPSDCARCGRPWGQHLHYTATRNTPGACTFYPQPGEQRTPWMDGAAVPSNKQESNDARNSREIVEAQRQRLERISAAIQHEKDTKKTNTRR